MPCHRCGECCITAFFISSADPDRDEKELSKWYAYHRCQAYRVPSENGRSLMGVKIPLVCAHLDRVDGQWGCGIYETRPVICRDYLCPAAKENP